jgi:uncharacterized membrane protein YgaE (UPF0421/DUF939 family)
MQKKKADKFIVDTNKFLTDKMYLLNELHSELYTVYRRFWSYFFHNKENYSYKIFREENEIKECFRVSEQHLDNLWLQSNKPSANYVLFQELRKTVQELININLKLCKIIENKSIAPEDIRLSDLLSMLHNTENEINNYGSNQFTVLDKMAHPVHELKIAL